MSKVWSPIDSSASRGGSARCPRRACARRGDRAVVEDRTDRSVGERADLDGACGGGFETIDAERFGEAQNAEAGSESLLGVRPPLQDEIAQRGGRRADAGGVLADAADGPVGVAARLDGM